MSCLLVLCLFWISKHKKYQESLYHEFIGLYKERFQIASNVFISAFCVAKLKYFISFVLCFTLLSKEQCKFRPL